ncbi:MAG: sodium:proton antiporter [Myxococcaceae bacterium]
MTEPRSVAAAAKPASSTRLSLLAFGAALAAAIALLAFLPHGQVLEAEAKALRTTLSVTSVLPFAALLLCIAVLPLTWPHRWEDNRFKAALSLALALPVAAYLSSFGAAGWHELLEKAREYVSFILLLGALYVISGGIHVKGSLSGTPLANTALLGVGAVLASVVGTTGASMLLIRPYLRANVAREKRAHLVVFFIFVVANSGGLLTPLGDPPLFLGFLKGVPFGWTATELWPVWLGVNAGLLLVFNLVDQWVFAREELARPGSQLEEVQRHVPLGVEGAASLLFLGGVVGVVYLSGSGAFLGGRPWPFGVQEAAMAALAAASYALTRRGLHQENGFSFAPIVEVAVLFAGIFVTMAPALLLLNRHGAALGLEKPAHYFWATGLLSSFLDNAPTYMTFSAAAAGSLGVDASGRFFEALLAAPGGGRLLVAISCGAVLMGANTYIGNGPNFMVKAVAEQAGVKMPSFFGYMAWSMAVLIPAFVLLTLMLF